MATKTLMRIASLASAVLRAALVGAEPASRGEAPGGTEVREFVVAVPEQENPSFYPVQLTNTGPSTATFSLTFNGALYESSSAVRADILRMAPEYANEPVYRKAWRFIRDHRYHYTPLTELRWQHEPALFLNSLGFGYCDDSASLLYHLWQGLGYEARVWDLHGHVVSEVFTCGRWEMYDAGLPGVSQTYADNYLGPQQCVYYYNRHGQVAGVEELAADGTLITEPCAPVNPSLETSSPYYCYSPDVARLYTSTQDNWVEAWYMVDEPEYVLQLQVPPGGRLLLPGRFANLLRVAYGDPSPPLMVSAVLVIPAGYSGTLDNRLVVHSIRGSPSDTVSLCGRTFPVGSPELQDFIDERASGRGSPFSAVTFPQVTVSTEAVFLLNPLLVEMQHDNVLRLTGTCLSGMAAEIPGVTSPADLAPGASQAFTAPQAEAGYNGGTGQANDPYQIASAADLILLSTRPGDYDRHFILTADIDLDPTLPGGRRFGQAVIPSWAGMPGDAPFAGVFDGHGHTISHLAIRGGGTLGLFWRVAPGAEVRDLGVVDVNVMGSGDDVAPLVGDNRGTVARCWATGLVTGHGGVGGLVGENQGRLTQCTSVASIHGQSYVGGLVGYAWAGHVTQCYSMGAVDGNDGVGGLVGANWSEVTGCYSTGAVHATGGSAGGLVGWTSPLAGGVVAASFWDTQTSNQSSSVAGGEGLTTDRMQTAATFLAWGACGNEGVWTIDEGRDYPRLQWERRSGAVIGLAHLSGLLPGTGTAEDPFQVSTAQDLNWIGLFPCEWDKHFRLCADLDLSAFDGTPGRPAFNPIAPGRTPDFAYFLGTPFTGVFDGNRHTIRHLTLEIKDGGCGGLFGGLGSGAEVKDLGLADANVTSYGCGVGALAGYNSGGRVAGCYTTGTVTGRSAAVGGLLGWNYGTVTRCYSTSTVRGEAYVGGLVGYNGGAVTGCYSAGAVSGTARAGGLVAYGDAVSQCLWDTQTSGQGTSAGGTGRDTAQMRASQTFLDAGWNLLAETANGLQDPWGISEGKDYPRFVWQFWAFSPAPANHAIDVNQTPTLSWLSGPSGAEHDVYFGEDENAVASATPQTQGVYQGRQRAAKTTFSLGALAWGRTYYWRIDEVREDDARSPWKGGPWSFSTADSIVVAVVDDFEAYNDDWVSGPLLFDTWSEGGNALVGNWAPPEGPYAEQTIVHGLGQSMPLAYDNTRQPWFSQAERTWETPQDWTRGDPEALTLYVHGQAGNGPDPLYVVIEDCEGHTLQVTHPEVLVAKATQWQKWDIPLPNLRASGVDLAAVTSLVVGLGDRSGSRPGSAGKIYIDDVRLTRRIP